VFIKIMVVYVLSVSAVWKGP